MNVRRSLAAGAAATALVLPLAACGDDGDTKPHRSSIGSADEVKDRLEDAGISCKPWFGYERSASCTVDFQRQSIFLDNDNPELQAAVQFDDDQAIENVIVGENWAVTCRRIEVSTCRDLADALGGEILRRGAQGPEVVPS